MSRSQQEKLDILNTFTAEALGALTRNDDAKFKDLVRDLFKDPLEEVTLWHEIIMGRVMNITEKMSKVGIPVDINHLKRLVGEVMQEENIEWKGVYGEESDPRRLVPPSIRPSLN